MQVQKKVNSDIQNCEASCGKQSGWDLWVIFSLYWALFFIILFIYLTTILLQAVAGVILSCHVEISKHNARKTLRTIKEMEKRIHYITGIYYSISETYQQY